MSAKKSYKNLTSMSLFRTLCLQESKKNFFISYPRSKLAKKL